MKAKQFFFDWFPELYFSSLACSLLSIILLMHQHHPHTKSIIDEDGNKVQLPLYDTNVGDFECQQGYLYQSFNRGAIVIFNKAGLPMRCKIVS